ncbi:MAG: 30S ribosomal protein S20 [Microgenomates group bacterium]
MPIIKSAIKKLRADKKRQAINKAIKTRAVNLIGVFRKETKPGGLAAVFSAIDRAAKGKVFHKKKADRLKSRLAKLLGKKK